MTKTASCSTEFRSGYVIEGSTADVRDSYKDTVIGGQARKKSIMGSLYHDIIFSLHGSQPYAINTQRKAKNAPLSALSFVFMA